MRRYKRRNYEEHKDQITVFFKLINYSLWSTRQRTVEFPCHVSDKRDQTRWCDLKRYFEHMKAKWVHYHIVWQYGLHQNNLELNKEAPTSPQWDWYSVLDTGHLARLSPPSPSLTRRGGGLLTMFWAILYGLGLPFGCPATPFHFFCVSVLHVSFVFAGYPVYHIYSR